jgi:hypothetical protein
MASKYELKASARPTNFFPLYNTNYADACASARLTTSNPDNEYGTS